MKAQLNDSNTTRIAVLEEIAANTYKLLDKIDIRMDRLETNLTNRIDTLDTRLHDLHLRIDHLETTLHSRIDSQFRWIIGTVILGYGAPVILKLLHWI